MIFSSVNKKDKPAFTLLELLVVIGIFTLLVSATVANYRVGNRQSQLRLAAQELAANIHLAQSYAIGSKDFINSSQESQPPSGGWGIYLTTTESSSYKIIVDLDENHLWVSSSDDFLRTINLPQNVIIDEILINSTTTTTAATILFWPPEPQTFINGTSSNNVAITFKDGITMTTNRVLVNFFGLIEVE